MSNETMISREWASRPEDERFISLTEMHARMADQCEHAREYVVDTGSMEVIPYGKNDVRLIRKGSGKVGASFTNWSWSQLCGTVGAPAGYLARKPAQMACDSLNDDIAMHVRSAKKAPRGKLLIDVCGDVVQARAFTGPDYGRIWNKDVVSLLMDHVGDGVTGKWRVPGEFGKAVIVDRKNTALYASDRDMFVALANETDRITLPNRRDGKSGTLAQGIIICNSEVGDKTLYGAYFLFDYICCNRMIWGLEEWKEFCFKHTSRAPGRWRQPAHDMVTHGMEANPREVLQPLLEAQRHKLDDPRAFLLRFLKTKTTADAAEAAFRDDENRPLVTRWDAVTAVTALARDSRYQDERVRLEALGGKMLALAA